MNKKFITTFFCFFLLAASAYAHPHIFLKNRVEVIFDKNGLTGFKTFWYADDFSTSGLIDGYDENENGRLDDFEIKMFKTDSENNLKNFNYFTYIKINGKAFTIESVENFDAKIIDNKIVYSFFIHRKIPALSKKTEITFSQYDSSYFSFISFAEEQPVTIINNGEITFDYKIEENKNESYYFDMVHPIALILRFNR